MTTNYQMWLTYNAEKDKLRIPVLPTTFSVAIGNHNSSVDVMGLGEIVIKQARPAFQFSFSSFFPGSTFPGVKNFPSPLSCVNKIKSWIDGDKPIHVILTNMGINVYCTIDNFKYHEHGGDIGTIYYDLSLKEYRNISAKQVKINPKTQKAIVEKGEKRVDNTVKPKTYTVQAGDCLYNISKKIYGNGDDYKKIYNTNLDIIGGNPNLIMPGQILSIP